MPTEDRHAALDQLKLFAEDRYLHQTSIKADDQILFFEDLPEAIRDSKPEGTWRVHFHVPVFQDRFAQIGTTQREILECLAAMKKFHSETKHFEIETYAWNVLPPSLRADSLQTGIAEEIKWFRDLVGTED